MVTALWETNLPVIPRAMLMAPAVDGTAMDEIVSNLPLPVPTIPDQPSRI
jgi:hypothetical protein